MEPHDFLQLSAANSSLPTSGLQQNNLFASSSLDLPNTSSTQSGSLSTPTEAGITEGAMEIIDYSQSLHDEVLDVFGGMTEVATKIADSNQSLHDEVLDVFTGITEVTGEIVNYNQSLLESGLGESTSPPGEKEPVEQADSTYPLDEPLKYDPSVPDEYDEDPEVVKQWQQYMVDKGYLTSQEDVDGLYGIESDAATRQFQADQGLEEDGDVGPLTWEAAFGTEPPPSPPSDGSFKDEAIRIANEEWELFEQGALTETEEGAWQRVGDYWQSVGQDYTGQDTDVPWSAAFISWVMQEAGAGDSFEYNASHSYYIEDAVENRAENDTGAAFQAYRLDEYSPQVGDLVSYAREEGVDYDTPAPYLSHSDIVVATRSGEIDVVGGNVDDSVTQKTLEVDSEGRLTDTSEDWFAVLRNRENPLTV